MKSPINVLVYAWNHEGLGHVNRLLSVCKGLKELHEATNVFILAEQETPLLRLAGWPFVCVPRFPGSYKGHPDVEDSSDTPASTATKIAMARHMVADAFQSIMPDVIIHDTVLWMPLFEAAVSQHIPQVLILRYRKDNRRYLERIQKELQQVQLLVFPHFKDEIDHSELLDFALPRVHYSGPILRLNKTDTDAVAIQKMREIYGFTSDDLSVVITGGGGGYESHRRFFEVTAEALVRTAPVGTIGLIALGCFYTGQVQLPHQSNIRWSILTFEPHLATLMAAAKVVITQAGYNTMNELQMVHTPAILIPGSRPFDDQARRAHSVVQTLENTWLVESLDITSVQCVLAKVLSHAATLQFQPDTATLVAGRHSCARAILDLIS